MYVPSHSQKQACEKLKINSNNIWSKEVYTELEKKWKHFLHKTFTLSSLRVLLGPKYIGRSSEGVGVRGIL